MVSVLDPIAMDQGQSRPPESPSFVKFVIEWKIKALAGMVVLGM
jgi:hypothetical protein